MTEIPERIVAAAVLYKPEKVDKECPDYGPLIFSIPKPARHHNILFALGQMDPKASARGEQGFLTDKGRFLGRIGAKQLAIDNGQLTKKTFYDDLFSEDLW